MSTSRNLTAAVHQEEDWYVARCLEVDVASQGRMIDGALKNLAEAVELYPEEVDDPPSAPRGISRLASPSEHRCCLGAGQRPTPR